VEKAEIMRRTISSAQTFFRKWVFSPLWIGGFGLGTCALWLGTFHGRNGLPPPEFVKWAFLAAWLIGSGFILWFSGRIKQVDVDEEALYVWNYGSEVRIPLAEVSHFTQTYMSHASTITIHLRSVSPVGQRIVFIPQFRWVWFGTHPIITELQALCDRVNARGGANQPRVPVKQNYVFSMRVLQGFFIFFCLLSLLSAVTGIQSISITDHVAISRHDDLGRLYSIVVAALNAAAFYGIHRRALIAWKLGWVVLAAAFVSFVASALPETTRLPPPGCWIVPCFVVIGGSVVVGMWGMWWKRQWGYFTPQQGHDLEKDADA
jgi:hypothetical protein